MLLLFYRIDFNLQNFSYIFKYKNIIKEMDSDSFDTNLQEDNLINMIRYVLGEIGNTETDPSDIADIEKIENLLRIYYQMQDSLEPLKDLMPNNFSFHEYLNSLTSKFSREFSDNLRNNEKCT